MKTLTIIDTFGFFFRLYYAMSGLRSSDGKPSGMVNGFANFVMNLKNEFASDYIIFALDSKGKTFRSMIDPNYKANRQPPPPGLLEQLPVCIEMIEKMGLCCYIKEGFEADDIIASVVKEYSDKMKIRIVTHDKDLYQLINENTTIYSPAKKEIYDRDGCYEKYGVYPEQIIDFLAICGDASDNIPGIKGIGDKGAKKLLDEFGSLENIYDNLENVRNDRTRNFLSEGKENAFLSKKLASLYNRLEISDIDKAIFPEENPLTKVSDILESYSLNRILALLKQGDERKDSAFEAVLITDEKELESLLGSIDENTVISFDTETTSLESRSAKIVGFSFCFNDKTSYYVPIYHSYLGVPDQISTKTAKWAVGQIYKGFVVGQNLKYDFRIIKNNFDLNPPKRYADTMIYAWLCAPGESVGMDHLAKRLYNYDTIKFSDVVKKGENFASVDIENGAKYAAEDAWITLKFYKTFQNILEPNLQKLAKEIEFPFIEVLYDMEDAGIGMDVENLRDMIQQNGAALKELTEQIYELSGDKFNINSPKQLGEVLFERMGLPAKKKTKTGYSTDESVLSEIADLHEVVGKILQYRELHKLQTTYCDPLLSLALKDKEHRVYTNFLQTGTSTGRLSSKNPNLQNIPARGRLAKQMRECFRAKDGFCFISLDYSQIELRLLAHFSCDSALLDAFMKGEDIHKRTAISIFGESDDLKRAIAKSINFGLIYGMGSNKLSNEIGISKAEAKEYIQRYFMAFSTIKEFLEGIKNSAKNDGFVTTIMGRKRYFDFSSATPMQIAMYEREAVNTRFQGSAADIIKKAMLQIHPHLNKNANLLLQIHDELIFEVRKDLAQEFGEKVKWTMENVFALNVPLVANINIAENWGNLK